MSYRDPWDTMREFGGHISRTQEEIAQESLAQFLDKELDAADERNGYLDQFVVVKDGKFSIEIAFPDGPREFHAPSRRELYDQLRSAL